MTKTELKSRLSTIKRDALKAELKLIREYCFANNPVKVGDVITDHYHTIKVESISPDISASYQGDYHCIYYGVELTKSGKPKVKNPSNSLHGVNLIAINGVPYTKPKGD